MSSKNPRIFIARLPPSMTEGDLDSMFKKYGEIKTISLKKGYAFVVTTLFYILEGDTYEDLLDFFYSFFGRMTHI